MIEHASLAAYVWMRPGVFDCCETAASKSGKRFAARGNETKMPPSDRGVHICWLQDLRPWIHSAESTLPMRCLLLLHLCLCLLSSICGGCREVNLWSIEVEKKVPLVLMLHEDHAFKHPAFQKRQL